MSARHVTIVVHVDGDLASRQYRVPVWAFEAGRWGAVGVALLVVLFFAFAEPLAHAAARVPESPSGRWRGSMTKMPASRVSRPELNHAEEHYQELRDLLSPRAATSALTPAPEPRAPAPVAAKPRSRAAALRDSGRRRDPPAARHRRVRHPGASGERRFGGRGAQRDRHRGAARIGGASGRRRRGRDREHGFGVRCTCLSGIPTGTKRCTGTPPGCSCTKAIRERGAGDRPFREFRALLHGAPSAFRDSSRWGVDRSAHPGSPVEN